MADPTRHQPDDVARFLDLLASGPGRAERDTDRADIRSRRLSEDDHDRD